MVDPSEAARILAGLRKIRRLICPECGTEFEGKGRRRFCCRACARRYNSREYYRRRRERLLAEGGKQSRAGYWQEYYRRNREKILARRRARRQQAKAPSESGE